MAHMDTCRHTPFLHARPRLHRLYLGWAVLLIVLLAACRPPWAAQETPAAPATPAAPETATPISAGETGAVNRQLVVWLPLFSGLATDDPAAGVLESAFYQFEQSHTGVRIDAQVKAETGAAAMGQFLAAAQRAAPSTLPDLVLINTQQLWQLADLGMVPPLTQTEMLPLDDFYPFALDAATYHTQLLGVPYAADVVHSIYASGQEMPTTWDDLLAAAQPYLFPGSSAEGAHTAHTLLQYVGAGGELREDGTVNDLAVLHAYFDFLAAGRLAGAIPLTVSEMTSFEEVWVAYQRAPIGSASIQAGVFLAAPDRAGLGYAPSPTARKQLVTVAETWAFAVLAQDDTQRRLAMTLIQALLDPAVQGSWTQYARTLPTRRGALAQWTRQDAYPDFLGRELAAAIAIPNGRAFADFARRLQMAQAAVLRGEQTPDEAVQGIGQVQ
jgi:ABC-type glycerol-3-phosphate transport system substrate-binding protein